MEPLVVTPPAPAAAPQGVPALAECHFYHSIDLPVHGFQPGLWDLRHNVDAYLGHVPVAGRRVLEVGTANGFLCFELEKRGAEVVAYDLSPEHDWDIVPYGGRVDPEIQQDRRRHIGRLNNAWRLSHHLFGSRARLVHGTAYTIPEEIGPVDVATFGSILLHLRDPFLALQKAAALTTGTMIVTELVPGFFDARKNEFLPPLINDPEAIPDAVIPPLTFHPNPDRKSPWETWWYLSPRLVSRFLRVLGFPSTQVSFHTQRYVDRDIWLYTVVGRRG